MGDNHNIIEMKNLTFSYGNNKVLNNLNINIPEGKITTVIGGNGSGKSTLFHLLTKNLKVKNRTIYYYSRELNDIKLKEFATMVAIVHQYNTAPEDITVKQLVSYGRIPYKEKEKKDEIIEKAMEVTGILEFQDRLVCKLSGGQRQRVWIAMAIAQDTKILFLDEPTTYLDIKYQVEILRLIKKLNKEMKLTVVMILHDINQTVYYSDEIISLDNSGQIVTCGKAEKVLEKEMIQRIYGVSLETVDTEVGKVILTI